MTLGQRLKRAAGSPLRQFFDRRFAALDTHILQSGEQARGELTQATGSLVADVDRRFDRIAFDIAAVSRAHTESMSYVASEISRLEGALGAEIDALRRELAAGGTPVFDAYTLRALAGLPPSSRVLAVGHTTDQAPLHLAALGHRVTVLSDRTYPYAHANLDVVTGELVDFRASEPYAAVVVKGDSDDAPLVLEELVGADGLLVAAGVDGPDGFEVLDRSAAVGDTVGDASASGLALVTARRA